VGAKGCLRYTTARDAADHARWDARDTGGMIEIFDQQGQLYRKICRRRKPSLGRIEESLEEVEKITLPYFRVFLGLPTSGPSPPQKEESPVTH
jgi:hypothetical protein